MFKVSSFWILASVFLVTMIVSCVAAPVQEMSDARQAIQAASKSTRPLHINDELLKAQRMLKDAESALAEGEYKKAREKAQAARDYAMQAQKVVHNIE